MTLLLYSGGCRFCRWVVRTILPKLDPQGEVKVIPFRHPFAQPYLADLTECRRYQNWWLIKDGNRWAGNKGGGVKLLQSMTLTRPLGYMVEWLQLTPLIDKLDDWVKAHRPFLAGLVKDGEAPMTIENSKRLTLVVDFDFDGEESAKDIVGLLKSYIPEHFITRATLEDLGGDGKMENLL